MSFPIPVTLQASQTVQRYNMGVQESTQQFGLSSDRVVVAGTDKHYTHTQSVASARWEIQHNLHKYPSVTIVDSANTECVGSVQYVDEDNVVCVFEGAFSGYAYLN